MLSQEERQTEIKIRTNIIIDDLCNLKHICLVDTKSIDQIVKNIIENISYEMQQGFKRYFTGKPKKELE